MSKERPLVQITPEQNQRIDGLCEQWEKDTGFPTMKRKMVDRVLDRGIEVVAKEISKPHVKSQKQS